MMRIVKSAHWVSKAGAYFLRATWLQCPVCGRTPIFPRAHTVRRLWDWFTPFDGCPRCGYAFEREPGYFLLAIWAINCGAASLFGMMVYLALEWWFALPMHVLIPAVLAPVVLGNVLFARHSKAYFIALDHLLDPHDRGEGDDGGNQSMEPEPAPTEPCETITPVR